MNFDKVKKLHIPSSSGSYQYYNDKGNIIYVGKAANLRSRVFSYWRDSADHSPAKEKMMTEIAKVKWTETDSEIEALLLETNLIKKYQPYYNVLSRDDKRFIYIKISTEEEWPRVFATRKIDKSGRYFGPFISTEAVRETIRIIRKIWPYRSCRYLPAQACLYYQINKCPGMCIGEITKTENDKIIKQIILFLEGKKSAIIKDYEARIKKGELGKGNRERGIGKGELGKGNRERGIGKGESEKSDNENIKFHSILNSQSVYRRHAGRLQIQNSNIDVLKYQLQKINYVLSSSRLVGVGEKYANDVVELAKELGLPRIPKRIEGYDIANLFGQESVGSMVVFADGEPERGEYRKFKIRINAGKANDTGMLREVLERRFSKIADSNISASWPAPDLIVIDGGKGQLNAVLSVLKKFKLQIPAIAISKGDGLRSAIAPDKLFFPGEKKPLELPLASPALHLIKRVRDEAHRFAIGFHRKLRNKKMFNRS